MKSLNRILALGSTLSTLALCASFANAAQITATQEITAINNLKPVYAYATADTYRLTSVSDTLSDMDGMSLGAATATSNTYWYGDSSNNLSTMSTSSSIWRTFSVASVPASWSANGTIALPETINNGATQGSPAVTLTLVLTKTGTVADLTQTALFNYLQASTVNSITATTALTAIALGTTAPATGWTVKAYVSAGTAQTLDPVAMTVQWAGTTSTGSALNFTTVLNNLLTWNPSTGTPTSQSLAFTINGRSFAIGSLNPSNFVKTAGIGAGVLSTLTAGLGGGSIKKLNVANASFMADIPTSISSVRGKLKAVPGSTSANELLNLAVDAAVKKSTYVIGGFTTTADTNKYGLVAFTASDITSVTWDILNGTTLRATGAVGSAPAKAFTCDLSSVTVFKAGTAEVQRFSSADGDSFWLKVVDATGLDTSADASVGASSQDDLLVMQLLNKLSSTATIAKKTLEAIVASC